MEKDENNTLQPLLSSSRPHPTSYNGTMVLDVDNLDNRITTLTATLRTGATTETARAPASAAAAT
jgi:uncharacterized small protein (DUF1192 family)